MSKIVVAGDWHMNIKWAKHMVKLAAAEGIKRIVHVGDFGYTYRDFFVNTLSNRCIKEDVDIYFIDGNHDDHGQLLYLPVDSEGFGALAPRLHFIPRGHHWAWEGVTFVGLGGAVSVDKFVRQAGVSWWPTEVITWPEAEHTIAGGHADIMFTHDCPDKVDIPGISLAQGLAQGIPHDVLVAANQHRELLGRVVDEVNPALLIHGHYHRRYMGQRGMTRVIGLDMDGLDTNYMSLDLEKCL